MWNTLCGESVPKIRELDGRRKEKGHDERRNKEKSEGNHNIVYTGK